MYLVAGTRPEVIKLAPVYKELRAEGVDAQWLWTNQQPDLGIDTFKAFNMMPEHRLELNRPDGSLASLQAALAREIGWFLNGKKATVIVQGDTLSAAVAAQTAFLSGLPVAHVEAGLRTWDVKNPFPEEACRVWIDSIATTKFAPTMAASFTLSGEVHVVGQTGIDALAMVKRKASPPGRYAVVTMHRRENASAVEDVCRAVKRILNAGLVDRIVWPVHPNPIVRDVVPKMLGNISNVQLVKPARYDAMVNLLRGATIVLTDSGGVQEDCLGLHVPCLVLRTNTERPEGVAAGGAVLVGTDSTAIYDAAKEILRNPRKRVEMVAAVNPYGDGKASKRIAHVLAAQVFDKRITKKQSEWSGA